VSPYPLGLLPAGATEAPRYGLTLGCHTAMQELRLNRRHRWNQRLIRRALTEQRLVRSISMEAGGKIHIESSEWGDYWGACAFPASLLGRLEHAWRNLIVAGHGSDCRDGYVSAYFALLKWCLKKGYPSSCASAVTPSPDPWHVALAPRTRQANRRSRPTPHGAEARYRPAG